MDDVSSWAGVPEAEERGGGRLVDGPEGVEVEPGVGPDDGALWEVGECAAAAEDGESSSIGSMMKFLARLVGKLGQVVRRVGFQLVEGALEDAQKTTRGESQRRGAVSQYMIESKRNSTD